MFRSSEQRSVASSTSGPIDLNTRTSSQNRKNRSRNLQVGNFLPQANSMKTDFKKALIPNPNVKAGKSQAQVRKIVIKNRAIGKQNFGDGNAVNAKQRSYARKNFREVAREQRNAEESMTIDISRTMKSQGTPEYPRSNHKNQSDFLKIKVPALPEHADLQKTMVNQSFRRQVSRTGK